MLNDLNGFEHIYIACGHTDLKYGIDGLAGVIRERFELDPYTGRTIFLFCGRKSDRIKALVWEGDGFLLMYKRLEDGRFHWPRSIDELRDLSHEEFQRLRKS